MLFSKSHCFAAVLLSGILTIGSPAVLAQAGQSEGSDEDAAASAAEPTAQHETAVAQLKSTNACQKCDLSGADLTGLVLFRANLVGANLTNADMTNARLGGSDLTDANLTGAKMPESESDIIFCRTTRPDGKLDSKDCR